MSATPLELFLCLVAVAGTAVFILPSRSRTPKARSIGFLMAVVGICGFIWSPRLTPEAATASPTPEAPTKQEQFIQIVDRGRARYDAGSNDLAKGGTRPQRASEICGLLGDLETRGWTGTVSELSSNSDGKGVIAIMVAKGLVLRTASIDFGDGSKTLIAPGTALFQKAAALAKGQHVVFAGSFLRGGADCVQEMSLTLNGSMKEPEFLFKFSDISPR